MDSFTVAGWICYFINIGVESFRIESINLSSSCPQKILKIFYSSKLFGGKEFDHKWNEYCFEVNMKVKNSLNNSEILKFLISYLKEKLPSSSYWYFEKGTKKKYERIEQKFNTLNLSILN